MGNKPFNSKRWDINTLINDSDRGAGRERPAPERLFALVMLWQGRVSDRLDLGNIDAVDESRMAVYNVCCEELIDALEAVYPGWRDKLPGQGSER